MAKKALPFSFTNENKLSRGNRSKINPFETDNVRRKKKQKNQKEESSDEELDEDEAFNSEDERKYGALFAPSSKNIKKKQKNAMNDENEDFEMNSEEESDFTDHENDNVDHDENSSTGIASEGDDEEDGDGGQYMLDLLNNMDKDNDKSSSKKQKERVQEDEKDTMDPSSLIHSSSLPESQFSSSAIQSSNLTLDQLMNGISGTKGFQSIQNTMKQMKQAEQQSHSLKQSSSIQLTRAPAARIVSERASRKVSYQTQKEEISKYTDVVKTHREAETLDFRVRPKDRIHITKEELVSKFEPTTDFEKELALALEEAGVADENELVQREYREFDKDGYEIDKQENDYGDDLGSNQMTMEEYKKRRGQLAKMRALLFYEEQKRHHMNKIKSKKYRKIRKKQRLKDKENQQEHEMQEDSELAQEIQEKEEMERMKERMTLAHKNTSKWAKRMLRRGKNIDMDTRKALSAQIKIGDDLRKKMMDEYEDNHDNSDEDDKDLDDHQLVAKARAILSETDQDSNEFNSMPQSSAKNSIMKLAFMKKGLAAQRERAKEEARQLLAELEGNMSDNNCSDDEDKNDDHGKKKIKATSIKETEKVLPQGKLVASSLQFGNSNAVSVSGGIDIDLNTMASNKSLDKDKDTPSTKEDDCNAIETTYSLSNVSSKTISNKKNLEQSSLNEKTSPDSNPWIPSNNKLNKNDEKKRQTPAIIKQDVIEVKGASFNNSNSGSNDENEIKHNYDVEQEVGNKKTSNIMNSNTEKSNIATLTQEELVRRAFGAPSEAEAEEEFEKEKNEMKEREEKAKEDKEKDKFVSGWGSWTGEGVKARGPPKRLPKHLQAPKKKDHPKRKRQDDGKKMVIINEKKMKKLSQYQLTSIPHPFTSREQYDRAMAGAIGNEWNVSSAVKDMTRSDVITRSGKIIRPLDSKAKTKSKKRAPGKF